MTGIELIAQERRSQVLDHGYTDVHDDQYAKGLLAFGGAAYATYAALQMPSHRANVTPVDPINDLWPFAISSFKPGDDELKNLAKAGAMIAAEMDKIIRERKASAEADAVKDG